MALKSESSENKYTAICFFWFFFGEAIHELFSICVTHVYVGMLFSFFEFTHFWYQSICVSLRVFVKIQTRQVNLVDFCSICINCNHWKFY